MADEMPMSIEMTTARELMRPDSPARGKRTVSAEPRPARAPPGLGLRLYNLFPLLAGSVDRWISHLPRIAAMGFDAVYVNSFHEPGASGSLYAVRDHYRLNPLFRDGSASGDDELLRRYTEAASGCGLTPITDLIIGQVARDSVLAEERPDWFRREWDGDLFSPRAFDVHGRVALWRDLAALDYGEPNIREELIHFWSAYVRHSAGLGFRGFVCKSAHLVSADVWRRIIEVARQEQGGLRFIADTLGARTEETEALAGVGFDYIFNNAKWWDFRSDWLLEQQARLRRIAPSIAFPESHDTDRLAAGVANGDVAALEALLRFWTLFSASFSSGWMMPMGYEFGFSRRLDVVRTRPEHWEDGRLNISPFIAEVNAMRAACPALNVEGATRRLTTAGHGATGLLRLEEGHAVASKSGALILLNADGAS